MAEIKIVKKGKAVCWSYFGHLYKDNKHVDKNRNYCKICLENDKESGYKLGSSTTTLNGHLRDAHKIDTKKLPPTDIKINEYFCSLDSENSVESKIAANRLKKANQETEKIMDICIKGFIPIDIQGNGGIKDYLKTVLKLNIDLFDQDMAETELLDKKYKIKKQELEKIISSLSNVNICLNVWKHENNTFFISTKAYFVDDEWKLKTMTLPIITLSLDCNKDAMCDAVFEMLEKFNMLDKKIVLTSNFKFGLDKKLSCDEYFCFFTMIQNGFSKFCSQQHIYSALDKIFKIFEVLSFFDENYDDFEENEALIRQMHKIANVIRSMLSICHILEPMDKKCVSHVYSFDLLHKIIKFYIDKRRDIISILISNEKQNFCLGTNDVKYLEDVFIVSEVLVAQFQVLPEFPRLSLIPLVLSEIKECLENLKEKEISSSSYKYLEEFLKDLEEESKLTDLMAIAMVSDPTTVKSQQLQDFVSKQNMELEKFVEQYKTPSEGIRNEDNDVTDFVGSRLASLIKKNLVATSVGKGDSNLSDFGTSDLGADSVFDWWAINFSKHKQIEVIARQYLPVCGQSTGSNIQNELEEDIYFKKSTFPTYNLKKISFIYDNIIGKSPNC